MQAHFDEWQRNNPEGFAAQGARLPSVYVDDFGTLYRCEVYHGRRIREGFADQSPAWHAVVFAIGADGIARRIPIAPGTVPYADNRPQGMDQAIRQGYQTACRHSHAARLARETAAAEAAALAEAAPAKDPQAETPTTDPATSAAEPVDGDDKPRGILDRVFGGR